MLPLALRNRDFRYFAGGQGLSVFGSEFTAVAMAWQVYQLTDSPLDIGLIGLFRAVPQMALLLFGGLLADTVDRRRLMMAMQAGQFFVSATLAVLSASALITPGVLFAASAVLGVFTALETPGRQAIVPNIVSTDGLTGALALQNATRKIGSVAGPALAGLVLAISSPVWCYAVDAASWLAMFGALAMIHVRPGALGRRGGVSLGALKDGIGFVVTHPVMLSVMALDFGATLFGLPNALFPVYARDILHVGAAGLGVLYAATSVGAIAGGVAMSIIGDFRRPGLGILLGVTVYGVALALFAYSENLWLSAALLVISGIGNTLSAVLRWTIAQLITPDELRGRVSSVNSIFTSGGPRLGEFRAGAVAQAWGAEASALTGGIATIAIVAAVASVPAIRHFRLPDPANRAQPQPALASQR